MTITARDTIITTKTTDDTSRDEQPTSVPAANNQEQEEDEEEQKEAEEFFELNILTPPTSAAQLKTRRAIKNAAGAAAAVPSPSSRARREPLIAPPKMGTLLKPKAPSKLWRWAKIYAKLYLCAKIFLLLVAMIVVGWRGASFRQRARSVQAHADYWAAISSIHDAFHSALAKEHIHLDHLQEIRGALNELATRQTKNWRTIDKCEDPNDIASQIREIYDVQEDTCPWPHLDSYKKSQKKIFLISFFGGELGIDRFILGYPTYHGVMKLLTVGGFGVWWLVDWILILVGKMGSYGGQCPLYEDLYRNR